MCHMLTHTHSLTHLQPQAKQRGVEITYKLLSIRKATRSVGMHSHTCSASCIVAHHRYFHFILRQQHPPHNLCHGLLHARCLGGDASWPRPPGSQQSVCLCVLPPSPWACALTLHTCSTQVMETRVYEGIGISTRQARQRAAALALRKLREFVPGMM